MPSKERETAVSGTPDKTGLVALLCAAVLAGAMVMLYEFVAVRILARYFGSSLDVWASVISVMMAALSAGYATGGAVADRAGGLAPVGLALMVAGATGCFMEALAGFAGPRLLALDWGYALHPYMAAALVSFVPIFALGSVLPQSIRLCAGDGTRVGRAAGWVSALSTLGSIAGVVLTVHVFLTHFGVLQTLYAASGLLVLAGVALLGLRGRMTATAIALGLATLLAPGPARAQVLYENYSAYHHILVDDYGNVRRLRFDNAVQSTMALDNIYAGGFEYTDFFHVPFVLDPTITSALFIGLGGGTGPKTFLAAYPHIRVQAVEIDPQVVQVAAQFFSLPQHPQLDVIVEDGRVFLQRGKSTFGAIIVDAYASGPYGPYLPYHLATKEFFLLAWNRMNNGGTLVYNVAGKEKDTFGESIESLHATLSAVFQAVYVFDVRSSINTVFAAQKLLPAAPAPVMAEGEAKSTPPATAPGATAAEQATTGTVANPWPQGPWLKGVMSPQELSQAAQSLTQSGFLVYPNLTQRVAQLGRLHGTPPKAPIYTDNYAPVDLAPGMRGKNN